MILRWLLWFSLINYVWSDPSVRFHARPRGSTTGVRWGNGVVESQDGKLWITQGDGSVRIASVSGSDITEVQYHPTSMTNRTTECRSSIALHEIDGIVQYAVYVVIDMPKSDDQTVVRCVFFGFALLWLIFASNFVQI